MILLLMVLLIGNENRILPIPIIILIVGATIGVRMLLKNQDDQ